MLNDRRQRVLSALVEEYIQSAHPVGSRALVERYRLGCSPATVRNELSILEETGYVYQPHVSAGRVPTDSGYRSFVDELLAEDPALATASEAHDALLHRSEVDELMRQASALLTRLTNCMAVVLAPELSLSRIRRVDLLSMAPRRAIFVLITETGQVVNRAIELPEDATPERLAEVERAINAAFTDKRSAEIRPVRDAMAGDTKSSLLVARVVDEILDSLAEADRDRLYHGGIPALLSQPEFSDADHVLPIMRALEDGIGMLESLSEFLAENSVAVRIGSENRRAELGNVSIVATHYGGSSVDGVVGVIGPTRMDYTKAITAVRAVADGLNEALS